MEFSTLIKERRSIRKYQEADISNDDIMEIIKASQLSPSWKNSQTARFYVANTAESKAKVKECLPSFNQNSSDKASYIICTFKKGLSGLLSPDNMSEEKDCWGAYDLGLNNAYLILKAKELGYDTLIMGIRDCEGLKKIFDIPEDEMILPVIAIGKKEGEAVFKERKNTEDIAVIR
ncbi:MAG: nitroreductase family protein [Erysipelotrichaceae bacterium]|nr:nitroreductase family protein [Erysipelotrichaceae bacterium]